MMILKKKTMRRSEWTGIEERLYAEKDVFIPWGRARAGLMYMKRVDEPFFVKSFGKKLQVTGESYTWLQLAPEGEHFWATVMFDPEGKLFQYYFDITLENHLDDADGAWFIDLVLDVVMRPGGEIVRLDRHELDEILKNGEIDKKTYALALESERRLLSEIRGRENAIRRMCEEIREDLMKELNDLKT